jgi:ribosomal protein S12 methylthiotransferase accessory factor
MDENGLDFEDYREGLFNIFTRETVENAMQILEKEKFLVDITLHNDYYNMLAMYDRLESKKRGMVL